MSHAARAGQTIQLVIALLAVLASGGVALGQAAPPRQFAQGVLTTIPPAPEAEELFSGPVPLIEIPVSLDGVDYEPQIAAKSTTVLERSKNVTLRRTIWNLEFSFKPMRMIYVDVPQSTGRMQRKLVWYMVYRVRNLGGHMMPEPVVEKARSLILAGREKTASR